jgi:hypothetical protein
MQLEQLPRGARLYKGQRGNEGALYAVAIVFARGLAQDNRVFVSTNAGYDLQAMRTRHWVPQSHPKEGERVSVQIFVPSFEMKEVRLCELLVREHELTFPLASDRSTSIIKLPHADIQNDLPGDYRLHTMSLRRQQFCDSFGKDWSPGLAC